MKPHQDRSGIEPEMQSEYDFSGKKGVRGKFRKAYQQGHTVMIHREDGNVTTHYFTLEDGAVLIAPDVREYFPDSESVNQALRGLIDLIPQKQQSVEQASETG